MHHVWVGVKNVATLDFCIINLRENLMEPFRKLIEFWPNLAIFLEDTTVSMEVTSW